MMSEGDLMSVYKNQSDDLVYIPVYLHVQWPYNNG